MKKHKTALLFKPSIKQLIIHFSTFNERGNSSFQKAKMPEEMDMQERYKRLEVEDLFPVEETNEMEVAFIEHCLDKLGINLESTGKITYTLNAKQLIYLLLGVIRVYDIFLEKGGKFEE